MAITLGTFELPDGLVWEDEFAWNPVAQSTDYSLTGALIIQEATRLAGRPITLTGQSSGLAHTVWISRDDLLDLQSAFAVTAATFTLTLHDARSFTVIPRHDGDGPLSVEPLPVAHSFAPAEPDDDTLYRLIALRLLET